LGDELSASARRVQQALESHGLSLKVVELPASTRTAKEAAETIGCTVAQIAKSVVFRAESSGRPILVVASGVHRVNLDTLAGLVGEPVGMADPSYVRESTGFGIGGVPPIGHKHKLETYLDEDLLTFSEIWAAAGTPHAVFRLQPGDLPGLTGGSFFKIA
jgi:prolyl-tRNA editing enzyme YbaK/EbsC (Cys-tRNA(Pro) deacylase)